MIRLERGWVVVVFMAAGCVAEVDILGIGDDEPATLAAAPGSRNATGFGDTFFASGSFDASNPFFGSLGTNSRTCASCHQQAEGWSITPAGVQARFNKTSGTDPIFRTNDGSVSPYADVSTVNARRTAYAMLLSKGLIRVGIGIPSNAEFTLDAVDDPYGFASAAELSLFRRPLPATNLPFLPTIMWDGRETLSGTDMRSNLAHQALDATLGHAQATSTNPAQLDSIVTFESALFTAQTLDHGAGPLDKNGGKGGPQQLANTPFFIGINDSLSPGFNPNAMTLFDGFAPPAKAKSDPESVRRYAIYRGQQIFNTRQFAIAGVSGLNDMLGQPTITGTCTTCHDTPNVGNHSVTLALNIGVSDASRRTPDMPLYTLRNKTTGATVQTTDPGRALITGKWADIGKFKGPVLRGLQMRPPFFHNGMAASLEDVVAFYNARFAMGLTPQEQSDLLAFLQAL
ncbi:MAG TPA: hypothetical protein VFS15_13330 [Kofleriaceae bacterium]|nr:hypothetical protein [Kofleriaceae bacterium]